MKTEPNVGGWTIILNEGVSHVIPANEDHAFSDCRCKPSDDEGVVVHKSFDEREKFETGERKPS